VVGTPISPADLLREITAAAAMPDAVEAEIVAAA
jgi:hypothetical protein